MGEHQTDGLLTTMLEVIEVAALGLELLAVLIIVGVAVASTARFALRFGRAGAQRLEVYSAYKLQLGRGLLLGLEMLVAADIVRTVALEPTLTNVASLGLLVVIRTFLSWSLVVEIEHRWPWQSPARPAHPGEAP